MSRRNYLTSMTNSHDAIKSLVRDILRKAKYEFYLAPTVDIITEGCLSERWECFTHFRTASIGLRFVSLCERKIGRTHRVAYVGTIFQFKYTGKFDIVKYYSVSMSCIALYIIISYDICYYAVFLGVLFVSSLVICY